VGVKGSVDVKRYVQPSGKQKHKCNVADMPPTYIDSESGPQSNPNSNPNSMGFLL